MSTRKLFPSILFLVLSMSAFAQRSQRMTPNQIISFYGAASYPYQSAGVFIGLGASNIQGFAMLNTDLGGIVTNWSFPDNQLIGVIFEEEVLPNIRVSGGVGASTTLHSVNPSLGAALLFRGHYQLVPFLRLGATLIQPVGNSMAWDNNMPVLQISGSIDFQWYSHSVAKARRR